MRDQHFDSKSPKQTVSLTVNSDLYAKAKGLGINASQVAEEALAEAYATRRARTIAAEIQEDLAAVAVYEEQHGSFTEFVREWKAGDDEPI